MPFLQILNKEMNPLESDTINYDCIKLMEENPKNVKEQIYPHEKSHFQNLLNMSDQKRDFETIISQLKERYPE